VDLQYWRTTLYPIRDDNEPVKDLDDQIDALYQGPLAEFTSARAALSRTLPREDAVRVKALKKPTAIPWLVNQLYWRARPVYHRLEHAGQALRAAQIAVLKGRTADTPKAADAHRVAVAEAVHRSVALATEAGLHPDAEQLARMLEAISLAPAPPEHPGRFTDVVYPAAFEALAGITPEPRAALHPATRPDASDQKKEALSRKDRDSEARREEAVRAEHRRMEEARADRRRLEDELERADRKLSRAREREGEARDALKRAEAEVRGAEAAIAAIRARLNALKE